MIGFFSERKKSTGRFWWHLCLQAAGAIGVFFMVISLFGWSSAEALPLKQAVRACFTTDTDITPVIEWMESGSMQTNNNVIETTAPGY